MILYRVISIITNFKNPHLTPKDPTVNKKKSYHDKKSNVTTTIFIRQVDYVRKVLRKILPERGVGLKTRKILKH